MIRRYWGEKMRELWETSERKFGNWLKVELATLAAREELGQIPKGTTEEISKRTWMDADVMRAIERRDKAINHDLNAFVEIMRLQIILPREEFEGLYKLVDDGLFNRAVTEGLATQGSSPYAGYFHDGMTSYDTEEPAMALLLRDSGEIIEQELRNLQNALVERAIQHRGVLMIGRTHGQHAQPITFGVKLLGYLDLIQRAHTAFGTALEQVRVMKLSGAVGVYGTLGPKVEALVGQELDLEPVIANQILPLDRRARLVIELALIASCVGKIADDLWHMCQTEVGEIREPFSKSQKASSAMPHKKNPITLEQIKGLSRVVRNCAVPMMENIATSHERDIAHSSVERIEVPDAFGFLDHILRGLTRIIKGMSVFPKRMAKNLDATQGTIASQRIEMWLKHNGMPAEAAYRAVQRLCYLAVEDDRHLKFVLADDSETSPYVAKDANGLTACFDWRTWVTEEDYIYKRAKVSTNDSRETTSSST